MLVGLALEAGGVKGFSHIATLKIFESCDKKPDLLCGSSFGSIVATLYSMYQDADKVYKILSKRIDQFLRSKSFSTSKFTNLEMVIRDSIISLDDYYSFFKELYGRIKFSQLKIPTYVITFDSEKIESVVISEGYVVDAVLASCTVPGVFEPTHIAGVKMLDGGVLSPIPTHELRLQGADKVVASTFQDPPKKYSTHMELMIYVDSVKGDIIMEDELVLADFVFSYSVDVSWTEFSKYDKVYQNALKYAYDRRDEFENFLRR